MDLIDWIRAEDEEWTAFESVATEGDQRHNEEGFDSLLKEVVKDCELTNGQPMTVKHPTEKGGLKIYVVS